MNSKMQAKRTSERTEEPVMYFSYPRQIASSIFRLAEKPKPNLSFVRCCE